MMKTAKRTVGTASLCLALAAVAVLSALADSAGAGKATGGKGTERIVFASDRISGRGADNPEGDLEIFAMSLEGKKLEQLTSNAVDDFDPTFSSDGMISFVSQNVQPSNPEGDSEVYLMNADGSDPRNLTNTNGAVSDQDPRFSPDGQQIAFTSFGKQPSNAEGDFEVYLMNADGADQRNVTNTAGGISDFDAALSSDGRTVAYVSAGVQSSNPEGDDEIYAINADGSGRRNLTDTADGVQDDFPDFAPNDMKIAYTSDGVQPSNPEGDAEVYVMNALDGTDQRNLSRTGSDVTDVQPDYKAAASD